MVLRPLKSQDTSLDEYIEACQDTGSETFKARLLKANLKGTKPFVPKTTVG